MARAPSEGLARRDTAWLTGSATGKRYTASMGPWRGRGSTIVVNGNARSVTTTGGRIPIHARPEPGSAPSLCRRPHRPHLTVRIEHALGGAPAHGNPGRSVVDSFRSGIRWLAAGRLCAAVAGGEGELLAELTIRARGAKLRRFAGMRLGRACRRRGLEATPPADPSAHPRLGTGLGFVRLGRGPRRG
jgi:hypothetical protein